MVGLKGRIEATPYNNDRSINPAIILTTPLGGTCMPTNVRSGLRLQMSEAGFCTLQNIAQRKILIAGQL